MEPGQSPPGEYLRSSEISNQAGCDIIGFMVLAEQNWHITIECVSDWHIASHIWFFAGDPGQALHNLRELTESLQAYKVDQAETKNRTASFFNMILGMPADLSDTTDRLW
jgi:hypothetical protein